MQVEVVRVNTAAQMSQALSVRRRVFIEEQNVPEALEIDDHDKDPATLTTAVHVLALVDGEPVGTGRLLLDHSDYQVHIGRVAVLAPLRQRGIGRLLMLALHDIARQQNATSITLAAQLHAIGFYEQLGYSARGDVFPDAGIEHRWMDLNL